MVLVLPSAKKARSIESESEEVEMTKIRSVFLLMVLLLASCGGNLNSQGGQSLSNEISFFMVDKNNNVYLVLHNLASGGEEVVQFTTEDPNPTRGLHAWSNDGRMLAVTSGSMMSVKDFPSGNWETYERHGGNFDGGIGNYWRSVFELVDGRLGNGFLSSCVRNEEDYRSYSGICFTPMEERPTTFYFVAPEDANLTEGDVIYSWPSSDSTLERIAFIRQYLSQGVPSSPAQLMILETKRDTFFQVDTGDIQPFSAKISPSGERIAFLGNIDRNLENGDLWIVDTNGNNLKKLTTSSKFFNWSENGEKIVFEKDGDIWLIEADSGDITRITNTPGLLEFSPTFRPNH